VMILSSARISVIGTIIFSLYFRGRLQEVDTVMALLGFYIGAVDAFVCYREGMPGKALFRGVSGAVIGVWGALGLTGLHGGGVEI